MIETIKLLMEGMGIQNTNQLANKMHEKGFTILQPTLHRMLKGPHKTVEFEKIIKLARFFEVSIDQLIGHEPMTDGKFKPDHFKRNIDCYYLRLSNSGKETLAAHAQMIFKFEHPDDLYDPNNDFVNTGKGEEETHDDTSIDSSVSREGKRTGKNNTTKNKMVDRSRETMKGLKGKSNARKSNTKDN